MRVRSMFFFGTLVGCLALFGGGSAAAMSWAAPPSVDDVRALMQQAEFERAAEICAEVVDAEPENGEAWFLLGYTLHMDGQLGKAIRAHRRAAEFPDYRGIAMYNLGCAHALRGERDQAIEALAQASDAGFGLRSHAMDDSDLDSLRDDPRFMALLEREPADWQERIMAAVENLRAYFAEHGPEIIARLQVVAQEVMTAVQEALAQLQNGGARPSGVEAEELVIERPQQQQQERAQKPQRQQALATVPDLDSLMADQRWEEASRLLREVVREDPDNGRAWFMLGYSLHADGQLDEAIEAHKRASTFEEFKGIALYNLGCAYALQGNKQRAYGALRRSHDAGFDVLEHIEDDSDLESLRRDRRYRDFLAELKDPGSF